MKIDTSYEQEQDSLGDRSEGPSDRLREIVLKDLSLRISGFADEPDAKYLTTLRAYLRDRKDGRALGVYYRLDEDSLDYLNGRVEDFLVRLDVARREKRNCDRR